MKIEDTLGIQWPWCRYRNCVSRAPQVWGETQISSSVAHGIFQLCIYLLWWEFWLPSLVPCVFWRFCRRWLTWTHRYGLVSYCRFSLLAFLRFSPTTPEAIALRVGGGVGMSGAVCCIQAANAWHQGFCCLLWEHILCCWVQLRVLLPGEVLMGQNPRKAVLNLLEPWACYTKTVGTLAFVNAIHLLTGHQSHTILCTYNYWNIYGPFWNKYVWKIWQFIPQHLDHHRTQPIFSPIKKFHVHYIKTSTYNLQLVCPAFSHLFLLKAIYFILHRLHKSTKLLFLHI